MNCESPSAVCALAFVPGAKVASSAAPSELL
jgi:hypothetical protein